MHTVEHGSVGLGDVAPRHPVGQLPDSGARLARLLDVLARQVCLGGESAPMRVTFEATLRDLLGARVVRLREGRPPGPTPVGAMRFRRVSVAVPVPREESPVLLDVELDDQSPCAAWVAAAVESAARLASLVLEIDRCRGDILAEPAVRRRPDVSAPSLVGTSAAMVTLRENIARVAETDFIVLVEGESGTGKELVARQLHDLGHRRRGPFVAVNCAAIVESLLEAELFGIEDRTATGVRGRRGKFELADGGTLFLDEVSDLTPAAQAKLLRAIQELSVERVGGHGVRKVDARIVVATNKSLRDLVAAGQFRPDLFYRLSGVELHVPPLRARRQDIPDLCAFFLSRYQTPRPVSLSPEVLQALQLYDWPGNVRELERMIEGAVALASNGRIALGDLPPSLRGDTVGALQEALQREDTMRAWGARYARLVLERCRGNKRRACDALDISYHTLMAYLRWRPSRPSGEASAGDAPARDRVAPPDGTSSADRAVFG